MAFERRLLRLTEQVATVVQDHPRLLVGAVGAVWLLVMLRSYQVRHRPRDPVRLFTSGQNARARMLAQNRCEHHGLVRRCPSPGAHGDHWFPHSKGGATCEDNLVWLCARHNLRKSAKWPSRRVTRRLARRRRRYFPLGEPTRPGRLFR